MLTVLPTFLNWAEIYWIRHAIFNTNAQMHKNIISTLQWVYCEIGKEKHNAPARLGVILK